MTQDVADGLILGQGDWRYRAVKDWPRISDDSGLVEAIGVAVGPDDRLFVFNRGNPAVLILNSDGELTKSWGKDVFVRPHGITAAGDGSLYLTDDLGHRVAHFSPDGQLLRDIGPAGVPSNTGVEGFDYRSLTARGPYNLPTNVTIAEDGDLFISDGYGNASIHHFHADGQHVRSWGESGNGDGQFNVPHGICIAGENRILVADRENSRIQIFDREGNLQGIWTDVVRPCQIILRHGVFFVAELGNQNGRFPWQPVPSEPVGGRVSIFDQDGTLLSRWGGGPDPTREDSFYACHDICIDSQGNIYVGEVAVTVATVAGEDASHLPTLRKFEKINDVSPE